MRKRLKPIATLSWRTSRWSARSQPRTCDLKFWTGTNSETNVQEPSITTPAQQLAKHRSDLVIWIVYRLPGGLFTATSNSNSFQLFPGPLKNDLRKSNYQHVRKYNTYDILRPPTKIFSWSSFSLFLFSGKTPKCQNIKNMLVSNLV